MYFRGSCWLKTSGAEEKPTMFLFLVLTSHLVSILQFQKKYAQLLKHAVCLKLQTVNCASIILCLLSIFKWLAEFIISNFNQLSGFFIFFCYFLEDLFCWTLLFLVGLSLMTEFSFGGQAPAFQWRGRSCACSASCILLMDFHMSKVRWEKSEKTKKMFITGSELERSSN